MKHKITATIIAKNAQATLKECLESLREFDEIILLDNQSSDNTEQIAMEFSQKYGNLRLIKAEFIGFGAMKNLAIESAKNDWIFSIDSDEVLENPREILDLELNPSVIYSLPRKNLYNGEWIKACGWYPDYVKRVFNRTTTRFNDNCVHESVVVPPHCKEVKLKGAIRHYAYTEISQFVDKLQKYTELYAKTNPHKKGSMAKAVSHGIFAFTKSYFLQKGFFYGYKGFVISLFGGLGSFLKYAKIYEKQRSPKSCSLIITTYNQKERLGLVLDSARSLNPLPSEILIADDGSTSDTKELIESYAKDFPCAIRHIWHEDRGFRLSAIRNKAIESATGEYIIIIDGDMILESNFIYDHLRFAKRGVFLQGSRVILDCQTSNEMLNNPNRGGQNASVKRSRILSSLVYATSSVRADYFNKADFIRRIRGCNMSFYKSDCVAINGFNEEFVGWGREDSEFVARFLFNGGELRRLKFSAIAYHIYHDENSREMLESNHKIYLDTIKYRKSWCKMGLTNIS